MPHPAVLVAYEHPLRWDGTPGFPRPSSPRTPIPAGRISAAVDTWQVWRRHEGTRLDPFPVDDFLLLTREAEEYA